MKNKTAKQFDEVIALCRDIYKKKLVDYGTSWRILRPSSLTDQIMIKANRIRSIETNTSQRIDESIFDEYVAIVNYGIMGIIQLNEGFSDSPDMSVDQALERYDKLISEAKELMLDKNHDYGEAWRKMRPSSFVDLILVKLHRTKQIEDNGGHTIASEGIDANYLDIINYSLFALIRINETHIQ